MYFHLVFFIQMFSSWKMVFMMYHVYFLILQVQYKHTNMRFIIESKRITSNIVCTEIILKLGCTGTQPRYTKNRIVNRHGDEYCRGRQGRRSACTCRRRRVMQKLYRNGLTPRLQTRLSFLRAPLIKHHILSKIIVPYHLPW